MANKGQTIAEDLKIQGLLDRYLYFRNRNLTTQPSENHIDEDSLTAFVEGKLSDLEMPFILKHLVDCSFCLHVTGELVKLNVVFAEEETVPAVASQQSPSKISDVLNGLLSRIFGANDGTVFAHQEKDEEEDEEKKDS